MVYPHEPAPAPDDLRQRDFAAFANATGYKTEAETDKDNTYVQTDTYIEGITDPLSTSGSQRVVRGGGWYSSGIFCRSANRNSFAPADRYSFTGLRPVLAPVR